MFFYFIVPLTEARPRFNRFGPESRLRRIFFRFYRLLLLGSNIIRARVPLFSPSCRCAAPTVIYAVRRWYGPPDTALQSRYIIVHAASVRAYTYIILYFSIADTRGPQTTLSFGGNTTKLCLLLRPTRAVLPGRVALIYRLKNDFFFFFRMSSLFFFFFFITFLSSAFCLLHGQ